MKTQIRGPFIFGVAALAVRAVIGLVIMGLDRWLGEGDMLLFFDLPTFGLYFVLARLGYPHDIVNAYDLRFFLTGVAVWFVLGCGAGWLLLRLMRHANSPTSAR